MTPLLELSGVSVMLGRRTVLHDLACSALAGEVTAIIGPNGSGKTTLLRAIASELPHKGHIALNGRPLGGYAQRDIAASRAVLPQASQLNFPFTVHEIVRMGADAGRNGLGASEIRHLPARALERVDLTGFGHRLYAELSGGEQQRVQLARVLCQVWRPVHDGVPRLLLLDEPVASLDIRHQLMVMQIARDFATAGGGVIAVLHDLNLAALHAQHILALHDGRVVRSGTPAEVIEPGLVADVFGCALSPVDLRPGARLFAPEIAAPELAA